jgi:hypothetical protein
MLQEKHECGSVLYDNLWKVAYSPPTLVIFEDFICLHITEDHQLNDSLHITQNGSYPFSQNRRAIINTG